MASFELADMLVDLATRLRGPETLEINLKDSKVERNIMFAAGKWFATDLIKRNAPAGMFHELGDARQLLESEFDAGRTSVHAMVEAEHTDESEHRLLEAAGVGFEAFLKNVKAQYAPTDTSTTRYVSDVISGKIKLTLQVFFKKGDVIEFMESFISDIERP